MKCLGENCDDKIHDMQKTLDYEWWIIIPHTTHDEITYGHRSYIVSFNNRTSIILI